MEAAGVDSIWLEEGDDGADATLVVAAIGAVTGRVRLVLLTNKRLDQRQADTLQQLSRGRFVASSSLDGWRRVQPPSDRDSWAAILEQAGDDVDGILVPMSPRLLDILRHPDDAIDRSDLILAQG